MQKKTPVKRLRHKAFKISWGVGTWNNPGGCRGTPQGRSRPPGSNPSAKGISRLRARPGQPLKGLPGPRGTFFFRQEASRSRRPWGGSSAAQRTPCRSVKGKGVVFCPVEPELALAVLAPSDNVYRPTGQNLHPRPAGRP